MLKNFVLIIYNLNARYAVICVFYSMVDFLFCASVEYFVILSNPLCTTLFLHCHSMLRL